MHFGMEEGEQSLEPKEDRLKIFTVETDGTVVKISTEVRNGDGNMMEEVRHYGDENNSSEELKAVVETKGLGDVKDGEDEKNLNEVMFVGERNGVKQIKNGEEDEDVGETDVVFENEGRKDVDGEEKEAGDSQDMEEKKDFEKTIGEEKTKEVDVQNGAEMKFVVERAEDEAVEDVKYNNERYGHGDVEAIGGKRKEEDSNAVDVISVKELKNGEDEGGVEGMKVDENGKPTSDEKGEDSVLVQVEENDGGKARKDANDMEMVGTKDVVKEEAPDVKDEGRFVVREGEEDEKDNGGNADRTVGDDEKAGSLKRKRSRGRRSSETDEAKKNGDTDEYVEETEVNGSRKRSKEVLSSPVVSSSDRPVRERKTVERLVEVIEKGPDSTVIIEKGRGTPLREIPNVAYNLARKKPAELKFLHQTIFGRKGKAIDFKSNLLQFSGFAWHESEEKQRAKIKEKLDKSVKETLLELCDLFDLSVSKTNARKDEIILKVLDFLEAPQTSSKTRKRERALKVDPSKSLGSNFEKRSRQKHEKIVGMPSSDVKSLCDAEDDEDTEEDEDTDSEKKPRKEDEASDAEEKESEETGGEEGDETKVDADLRKGRLLKKSPKWKEQQDVQNSTQKQASSDSVKRKIGSNSKKSSIKTDGKNSLKTSPSKHPKAEKIDDAGEKALSRKKKDAESPKKSNSKSNSKEKSSGKASKGKAKSGREQKSGPTKGELRNSICKILKEVDFNTATFTDILNQLASEYKIDLTQRKDSIELMIDEELTKFWADEEGESQEEEEMQ